jgi:hypothetical protein
MRNVEVSLEIIFVRYLWARRIVFSDEHQQSDLRGQHCSSATETTTSSVCFRSRLNAAALTIQGSCTDIFLREFSCRCQWPRGLRRRSAAARLLELPFRVPPGTWMSVVSVLCCQEEVSAKGRSLVQRVPTESVCVCVCVIECDQMQQ